MKVPKSDFKKYKAEFLRLQNVLGLKGYKIYFSFEPLKDRYGEITVSEEGKMQRLLYQAS